MGISLSPRVVGTSPCGVFVSRMFRSVRLPGESRSSVCCARAPTPSLRARIRAPRARIRDAGDLRPSPARRGRRREGCGNAIAKARRPLGTAGRGPRPASRSSASRSTGKSARPNPAAGAPDATASDRATTVEVPRTRIALGDEFMLDPLASLDVRPKAAFGSSAGPRISPGRNRAKSRRGDRRAWRARSR